MTVSGQNLVTFGARTVPCVVCGKPVPVPPAYKGNHAAHGNCNTAKDPGP